MANVSFKDVFHRRDRIQLLVVAFCIGFGLCLILNTHPAGDGVWFWYAASLQGGQHLYRDLHLALQPLFILETEWCMSLLGKSWLASKVPAVFHLVMYCAGLLLLVRRSPWRDGPKALLLACAFFVSIHFEAFRLDDYHVLTDCFTVYSIVLLSMLPGVKVPARAALLTAVLGLLSGLAVTTRLNDGGALALVVLFAVLYLVPVQKWANAAIFCVVTTVTIVAVVAMTGDSLQDYAMHSVVLAAKIKSGGGHLLGYPLMLPITALHALGMDRRFQFSVLYCCVATLCYLMLIRPAWGTRTAPAVLKVIAGLLVIVVPVVFQWGTFFGEVPIDAMCAIGVFALLGSGAFVLYRILRRWIEIPGSVPSKPLDVLLLVPVALLLAGSLSSGGDYRGIYSPFAIFFLLALATFAPAESGKQGSAVLFFAFLLTISGFANKIENPYAWHTYRSGPMFTDRTWYQHPIYGPMYLRREQLALMQEVCSSIGSGPDKELLSLPFPYANYFCGIPSWHGYVQTFFDTSSRETILGLMDSLKTDPPQWILYQRQLGILTMHEKIYNAGRPLAQRDLDALLTSKVETGEWKKKSDVPYGEGSDWILIQTR
jgi:hypothetical protein